MHYKKTLGILQADCNLRSREIEVFERNSKMREEEMKIRKTEVSIREEEMRARNKEEWTRRGMTRLISSPKMLRNTMQWVMRTKLLTYCAE